MWAMGTYAHPLSHTHSLSLSLSLSFSLSLSLSLARSRTHTNSNTNTQTPKHTGLSGLCLGLRVWAIGCRKRFRHDALRKCAQGEGASVWHCGVGCREVIDSRVPGFRNQRFPRPLEYAFQGLSRGTRKSIFLNFVRNLVTSRPKVAQNVLLAPRMHLGYPPPTKRVNERADGRLLQRSFILSPLWTP